MRPIAPSDLAASGLALAHVPNDVSHYSTKSISSSDQKICSLPADRLGKGSIAPTELADNTRQRGPPAADTLIEGGPDSMKKGAGSVRSNYGSPFNARVSFKLKNLSRSVTVPLRRQIHHPC
jgi:hypothetical protein